MNVLHLFSNAKWTGPAEPALNLCVALRRVGVNADFACAPDAGASINKVVETARDRGIEPILQFRLSKHRHPIKDAQDRRALRRFLAERSYDLVHCHLDNDHAIAAECARSRGIPLVRSNYEGLGFSRDARRRRLLESASGVIEPSMPALLNDMQGLGLPRERLAMIPSAVDTERFDPCREVPDGRRWLGIPPDAFVVGIVARLQTHRHYEDFFEAVRRLADRQANVHAIVVGRGTKQQTVGLEPVKRLGLESVVHFPGFIDGENYVGVLKAFDVKVFLTPGSDGTCRAVREAMAMGKPAVVAHRGMLAEIVDDGLNGIVCDGSVEALAHALGRLAADRGYRRALARAAREKALSSYSLDVQARAVCALYERILAMQAGAHVNAPSGHV
ncbi:MAG TPA: glycosyltransferase family 4 protein [Candidatus Hydrogenedentes bacterium]|nr:glycosyltransferase family 4 protein [Candidatus Hydrogenedentota bacterium]HPG70263.1 glycosyltransferase family 4 protein [Candidatus Hydrogenedentota bacterium]